MSRLVSRIVLCAGLLAALGTVASVSGPGWTQQRAATVLRGPMSESPLIPVQNQGGCKNPSAFSACQAAENNVPGGCNWPVRAAEKSTPIATPSTVRAVTVGRLKLLEEADLFPCCY